MTTVYTHDGITTEEVKIFVRSPDLSTTDAVNSNSLPQNCLVEHQDILLIEGQLPATIFNVLSN